MTPAPLPPEPVGEVDAPTEILLGFDGETGSWQRVPGQAVVMSQTSYLSLPTYRPRVRLVDQVQLDLIDDCPGAFGEVRCLHFLPHSGNRRDDG